jgi:hypothetical protein
MEDVTAKYSKYANGVRDSGGDEGADVGGEEVDGAVGGKEEIKGRWSACCCMLA